MTTIKEISIQEVGQPYSIKIERGQKGGYGYEIGIKADNLIDAIEDILAMKNKLEAVLYEDRGQQNILQDH